MDGRKERATTGIYDTRWELEQAVQAMAKDKENYPSWKAIGRAAGIHPSTAAFIVSKDKLNSDAREQVTAANNRFMVDMLWRIPDLSFLQEDDGACTG